MLGKIKDRKMGLACSQARLLALTARKADCEYGMSIDSIHKMALTREMSQLSSEYYSRLQSKQIAYYANGKYNKMNYSYLMGYGNGNYGAIWNKDTYPLKSDNSMILTDYKGQVVLSNEYAQAITSVLGSSAMNSKGAGSGFSLDKIPAIIAALDPAFDQEEVKTIIDTDKKLTSEYTADEYNQRTNQDTGNDVVIDNTEDKTQLLKEIVDFYYPIFAAAAANGWTTEYNKDMNANEDYVSDALISGTFQLATVNNYGDFDDQGSLTYFITAGLVESRNDADAREEITAWYNAEKERISEKESILDLHINNLSMELEAINTEIQSIQSLIDDAVSSVFDWGGG